MFDDLDDPGYAGPGSAARNAVAARAGRIRRNRRIAWTSGVASFVLVAVALGAGLRSRPQGLVGIEPVSPVTASATATATTVSPSPTAERSPTPTVVPTSAVPRHPSIPKTVSPASRPTPLPGPSMPAGWSCAPATEIPPEGGAPADGVTLSLEAPAVVVADSPGEATLVLTNGTDEGAYVRFFPQNRPGDISGPFQTVMTNGAGTFSGILSDGVGREARDLLTTGGGEIGAGESYRMPVQIMTWGCDTDGGRVPPGTYRMSVGIEIDDGGGFGSPTASPSPAYSPPPRPSGWDRTWATAAVTITVR